MADLDKVKRNIERMVGQNAPESDIDEYIRTEGVSIDDIRAHKIGASPNVGTLEGTVRRATDSFTFGFNDKASAAISAGADVLGGSREGFGARYQQHVARNQARTQEAKNDPFAHLVGDTAGMTAQGLLMMPEQAAVYSYQAAKALTEPAVQGINRLMQGMPTAARYGAAYGAADAAGHSNGSTLNQLGQVIEGAGGGAALGPVIHAGMYGAGGLINKVRQRRDVRRDAVAANADEARAVGVMEPLGPAMSDTGPHSTVARMVGAGVGGKPIGDRAAANISDWQTSLNRRLASEVDGKEAGDLGKSVQDDLRRALAERSKSSDEISRMTDAELQGIVGPITDSGFGAPRAKVVPVRPRDVPDIPTQDVGQQPAQPQKQPIDQMRYALAQKEAEIQGAVAQHNKYAEGVNSSLQQSQSDISALGIKDVRKMPDGRFSVEFVPEQQKTVDGRSVLSAPRRMDFDPKSQFDQRLLQPDQYLAIQRKINQIQSKEDVELLTKLRIDKIRSMHAERDRLSSDLNDAIARNEAESITYSKKSAEYSKAQAEARSAAARQTAEARSKASMEAEEATRNATIEAEKAYQNEVRSGRNSFQPGRSAESYPTEFDAAYKLVDRNSPNIPFNQLGTQYEKTLTTKLLEDVATDASKRLKLEGYSGDVYGGPGGGLDQSLAKYLRKQIGSDLAGRFEKLAELRARGGAVRPSLDAARALMSDLGKAARAAEKPPYPELPRTEAAALMRRLQSSLKEDFYAGLARQGQPPTFNTGSSEYKVLKSGATQSGGRAPSDATYYLNQKNAERLNRTPPEADKMSSWPATTSIRSEGGNVGRFDNVKGEFDRSSVVPSAQRPEPGLVPVQVWDGGHRVQFGGPIVSRAPSEGERAVAMYRNVDQGYSQYINDLRRPLGKIFGQNVEPVQALDRLAKAAMKGETSVVGAYARVMAEKSDINKGASALIYHMTNGGRDMRQFLSTWREMPSATKDALFRGEKGGAFRSEIERYARVGERLDKYVSAAKMRPVADPTRITHLLTISAFFHNMPLVVGMVGGNAMAARLMSSPKYLKWLSEVPSIARGGFETHSFREHIVRLSGIAASQNELDVLRTVAQKMKKGER